jgi:hypothetical protein
MIVRTQVPHAGASIAEMESESFDVGTNSTASVLQIGRSWHPAMCAIYRKAVTGLRKPRKPVKLASEPGFEASSL